jgi:O-methyltransferase
MKFNRFKLAPRVTKLIPTSIHKRWLINTIKPFTLISRARAESLYNLANRVLIEKISGDYVECGVCNGGTAAILAHFATLSPQQRTTWLFDSFEGMPLTTQEDGETAKEYIGKDVGILDNVKTILHKVNADMENVQIIKGWYEDTFPHQSIQNIALLNIDADWYSSVKLCLETFYDKVTPDGFISIDDYGHWPGCKKAVDEFFAQRNLSYKFNEPDYTARWFQKTQ